MYYTGSPAVGKGATVPSAADHNNVFTFGAAAAVGPGMVEIYNLDLARVVDRNDAGTLATVPRRRLRQPGRQPQAHCLRQRTTTLTIVAVHQSSGLDDDIDQRPFTRSRLSTATAYRLRTALRAGNTFATIKTVKVDNVRPALITNSPAIPLIVRGNTDVTFSADFTDGGAGFDAKFDPGLKGDLAMPRTVC